MSDMTTMITVVRKCCAVVWWFLSWFEVLVRCYQFFTPDFIQRRVRAAREANANRWASFMEDVYGAQFTEPCVVVFSYEASERARHLLADLAIKPRGKVIFIYSEDDVTRLIPTCSAYMVFLDHDENSVILEEEADTTGLLRLRTVKTLEQKAYGSVSVVYLDDRGPDLVPEDYLFNPHLASAYAHPVLGPLSQQERLFSVKTTWNNTQRHIIRDWLSVTGQTMDRT